MTESTTGLTGFEKLFKNYNFTIIQRVMGTRPGWNPKVGLTVHGTTWMYMVYNPGDSEHYWDKLASHKLAKIIINDFKKRGVKIHS